MFFFGGGEPLLNGGIAIFFGLLAEYTDAPFYSLAHWAGLRPLGYILLSGSKFETPFCSRASLKAQREMDRCPDAFILRRCPDASTDCGSK